MVEQDLQKMRKDLDTFQDVVGAGLPYGPSDVKGMLMLGALALCGTITSLLPLGINHTTIRMIFGPLVVLGCVGLVVRYYRNKPERTHIKDRETLQGATFFGIGGGLSFLFVLWSMMVLHLEPVIAISIHFYLFGCFVVLWALTKSTRYIYFPVAAPLFAYAIIRPQISWSMDFTLISAVVAAVTLCIAIGMHVNLRKQENVVAAH